MSESLAKSVPACSSLIALNGQPAPCAHAYKSSALLSAAILQEVTALLLIAAMCWELCCVSCCLHTKSTQAAECTAAGACCRHTA